MNYWDDNLVALAKYHVKLAVQLQEMDCKAEDTTVYEMDAKDGNKSLVLELDGAKHVMNSRFRPIQEAVTYVSQFSEMKEYSVSVFYGFGNGLIPKHICNMQFENVYYAFYEPHLQSFLYAMNHCDLTEVFDRDNVRIYVEGLNENELALELPFWVSWKNLPLTEIYPLPKYKDIFLESYKKFLNLTRDVIMRAHLMENTMSMFAQKYLQNSIQMMRFIPESTSAAAFVDVFPKEMPAVLVSAGPSLSKNIQTLKNAKNHSFILCVDTALRRLLAENIIPDAVIGIDPRKYAACREEWKSIYQEMAWITETNSNYAPTEINESYRNIFLSGEELIANDMFERNGVFLPNLSTGGSVANTAFSLLTYWGFQTIIMVGQDLAFTGNKRYSDSNEDAIEQSKEMGYGIYEVDGYYGEKVKTRDDYLTYLKWFEGTVSKLLDRTIINATEGGAMIHGATNMTLEDALSQYAKNEYSVRGIIDSVEKSFSDMQKDGIYEQLKNLPSRAKYFKRQFKEGKSLCERAITLLERSNMNEKEYMQIQKKLSEIDASVSNELEFILISNRAVDVDAKISRDMIVNSDSALQSDKEILDNMKQLYEAFLVAAEEMETESLSMVEKLDADLNQ